MRVWRYDLGNGNPNDLVYLLEENRDPISRQAKNILVNVSLMKRFWFQRDNWLDHVASGGFHGLVGSNFRRTNFRGEIRLWTRVRNRTIGDFSSEEFRHIILHPHWLQRKRFVQFEFQPQLELREDQRRLGMSLQSKDFLRYVSINLFS